MVTQDTLIEDIPEKFRGKVIPEKQQQAIEKAVRAFHPINKHVLEITRLPEDVVSIITPLAIPTVEVLSLMESLRGVPYGEGGKTYKELLYSAARLVVNNPSFNFRAIQFTGNHDDDRALLSFVGAMLANDYKLKLDIEGEEQELDLKDAFKEIYTAHSFEKLNQSLAQAVKSQVQPMPSSELGQGVAANSSSASAGVAGQGSCSSNITP